MAYGFWAVAGVVARSPGPTGWYTVGVLKELLQMTVRQVGGAPHPAPLPDRPAAHRHVRAAVLLLALTVLLLVGLLHVDVGTLTP